MCVYVLQRVVPVQVTAGVKAMRLEDHSIMRPERQGGARAGRWDQHSKELGCF